jgi:hypothetical protein
MAAVIPEAAEAVSSGTEAVEGASARARARVRTRPAGASRARGQSRAQQLEGGQRQTRERSRSRSRSKAGRGVLRARLPGSHSYQPVILAEFLVGVVLVATGPVAKGGTPAAQAKGSPSPYSVNTLKQLIAIGMVYFVLALLGASQRAGRYAAWFGGLVLLGLGFAELANGDLTAVFKIFAPGGANTSAGGANALGGPLFAPGVTQSAANAAANALGNPTDIFPTVGPGGVAPSLIDSGQTGSTATTNINFTQPGVITSDSGGQLALPDPRLQVGERRGGHHRPEHRQLDRQLRPERAERAGHRV